MTAIAADSMGQQLRRILFDRNEADAVNAISPYNSGMTKGKLIKLIFIAVLGLLLPSTMRISAAIAHSTPSTIPAKTSGQSPHAAHLILCSDGKSLWLVEPSAITGPPRRSGFTLLLHKTGDKPSAPWTQVSNKLFLGTPLCAAASVKSGPINPANGLANGLSRRQPGEADFFSSSADAAILAKSRIRLLFFGGTVQKYGPQAHALLSALPASLFPVAAAEFEGHLAVLAFGKPPQAAAAPRGPALAKPAQLAKPPARDSGISKAAPTTLPAPAATRPTDKPAANTTATKSGRKELAGADLPVKPVTAGWYLAISNGGGYRMMAIDGLGGPPDPRKPAVWPGLAAAGNSLWIAERGRQNAKIYELPFPHGPESAAAVAVLNHPIVIPLPQRTLNLMLTVLKDRVVVLWSLPVSDSREVRIFGGMVQAEKKGSTQRFNPWQQPAALLAANLENNSDLPAAAGCGNRIYVVARNAGVLHGIKLAESGRMIGTSWPIVPVNKPNMGPQNYERMIIMGLILLMILSLWQRKTSVDTRSLTEQYSVARLYLRFGAALVDMGVGAVVIMVIYGLYSAASWTPIMQQIRTIIFAPEDLFLHGQLLIFLGIYEFHVTLGELLFGRSLGKFLFSLRVVSEDGGKPGFVAVIMRNLFRIPEMLFMVLLILIFVSVQRQRLGDLLARTVVVGPKEPKGDQDVPP